MAVVYAKKRDGKLEELGRTEVVLNSLNLAWIEKLQLHSSSRLCSHWCKLYKFL